ncbi:alpha/beta hydrolase [Maribacter flavus]|uniref:Proline iminopeptidase n=1 Tax=Maribacter flavus TaxID=1658664 RepID=A0A5B2TRF0_9FLAO|nr:alpha/beta hydrolase [Maribacter flavus]KAA2217221.1 alpha/beta hydrolase [Maribacter flavus]
MKLSNLTFLFFLFYSIYANAQGNSINEERFISIGGIEQWITIKGNDKSKPVVLFLHGGPGSTMSHFENNIYGSWENDFVLVHWDQRGAGKTYGRNFPSVVDEEFYIENPLKVEQMANDGIELTKYIIEYLDKQKVILVGTSWGSVLGMKMALKYPDFYHVYIGHSQVVDFSKNISYAYKKVNEMAINKKDSISLELLHTLDKPPYENARSYGQLLRIIKKYEGENSIPAPESWWKIAPKYDNEKDTKARYDGDDYSFINFVGHEKLGIPSMVSDIDFEKDGLVINIPVYLIQGEQDILTSKEVTKPYFDKIKASKKGYYLVPGAAHGHNQSVVDMQYQVIKESLQF